MEDAPEYQPESVPVEATDVPEPAVPSEPAPAITSRFLFVDVAALRAKQLRRGARLRYDAEPGIPGPKKPERQAMEEVKRCLVQYAVPIWRGVGKSDPEEQA